MTYVYVSLTYPHTARMVPYKGVIDGFHRVGPLSENECTKVINTHERFSPISPLTPVRCGMAHVVDFDSLTADSLFNDGCAYSYGGFLRMLDMKVQDTHPARKAVSLLISAKAVHEVDMHVMVNVARELHALNISLDNARFSLNSVADNFSSEEEIWERLGNFIPTALADPLTADLHMSIASAFSGGWSLEELFTTARRMRDAVETFTVDGVALYDLVYAHARNSLDCTLAKEIMDNRHE